MGEEMGVSQGGGTTGSALERHTPGPWEVWDSLYEGMAAAVVRAGSDPLETVAEVRNFRDARVVAAAPELLEALRRARTYVADLPIVGDQDLALIDAAIAKAEGLTKNPRSSDPGMNKESVSP